MGGKRELSERNKSNKLRGREIVREIVKKIDDKERHISRIEGADKASKRESRDGTRYRRNDS